MCMPPGRRSESPTAPAAMADAGPRPGEDGRRGDGRGAEGEARLALPTGGGGEKDASDPAGKPDKEGEQRRDPPKKGADEQERLGDRVYQDFYGTVFAPYATFGSSAGAPGNNEWRGGGREEGPVEEADIAAIVRVYAKPGRFAEADKALRDTHVVIVAGAAGSGRRAGGIVLLDGVRAEGKPLVRINPSISLEKLAARAFNPGTCYLISEKFDEPIAPELAEFHWDALSRGIRNAKAYLVVTTSANWGAAVPETIGQVRWTRPGTADVLRAHLGAARVPDEVIQAVTEALGEEYPLADIGAVARRVLAAEDIEELLHELGRDDQQAVADWLNEVNAAIPAVLEAAALAFVLGVPERVFEDELTELKLRLADFAPELDTSSKKVKAEVDLRFRQLRKQRADHKLLTVIQVPVAWHSGAITVRHVDFRVPAYRRHVIAALWNSLNRDFWSGMRGWLRDIVAVERHDVLRHRDLMSSAAIGLGLLALVAPDEVIDSYLLPWTADDATASEQTMAVYTVWRMSMLDQVAPLALRIAILWAGQGSRLQRGLAAYAFSGELGIRYPLEATKRLGQLSNQREPAVPLAFARLFTALAAEGGVAFVVLSELRRLLADNASRRSAEFADSADRRSADFVLDAVIELVAVRDFASGRPAAAMFLRNSPGRATDIGLLWARVLLPRPWRERAVEALVATVQEIAKPPTGVKAIQQPPVAAGYLVRALGSAIGREVPSPQRGPLCHDISRWVDRQRRRDKRDRVTVAKHPDPPRSADFDELLEQLLDAIMHPASPELDAQHD